MREAEGRRSGMQRVDRGLIVKPGDRHRSREKLNIEGY